MHLSPFAALRELTNLVAMSGSHTGDDHTDHVKFPAFHVAVFPFSISETLKMRDSVGDKTLGPRAWGRGGGAGKEHRLEDVASETGSVTYQHVTFYKLDIWAEGT